MKNKINFIIIGCIIPFLASCQSSSKLIRYSVSKIDSTSLSKYYLISFVYEHDSLKVISKKQVNHNKNDKVLYLGQKASLTLTEVSSIEDNNIVVRIKNGYYIDSKLIIGKNEKIYLAKEISGLYYCK